MHLGLRGKVAVVTGASKGIGAGIAKGLAAEGAAVVVNYASSKADADRVVGEIVENGGKAVAMRGSQAAQAQAGMRLFGRRRMNGSVIGSGPKRIFRAHCRPRRTR